MQNVIVLSEFTAKKKKGRKMGMEAITLSKPITFDDKEYTELKLDLEGLTGDDIVNTARESRALGDTSPVVEYSKTFQAAVAARAAKVPIDLIMALPVRDFTKITLAVQNFLFE